jgi:hypothetical protein
LKIYNYIVSSMTRQSQLNNVDSSIDEINPFQEEIDANDADDSILPTIPSMLGSTRDSLAGNDLRDFRQLVYDQDQQQLVLDQQQLDSNLQPDSRSAATRFKPATAISIFKNNVTRWVPKS